MSDPIDHLKKLAKGLLRKAKASEPEACGRIRAIYSDGRDVPDAAIAEHFTLGRAQHVVAVEHGFASWDAAIKSDSMRVYLAITMFKHPDLSDFGIGVYDRGKTREEREAHHQGNRAALAASAERVGHVVEWLKEHVAPIKTLNPRRSSYGIKHVVEKELGYITNGVFIAAGIIAGYPHEIRSDSPNVRFGMSEKSLKQISKDHRDNKRPYAWRMPDWTDPGREPREALWPSFLKKAEAPTP